MSTEKTSPSRGPGSPDVTGFYDAATGSAQYVVSDPATKSCAIIDAVLDFDVPHARTGTASADRILAFVRESGLQVEWVLDTHPHADHLMAGSYLKRQLGAPQAIGEKTHDIAKLWRDIYNLPHGLDVDASFDRFFSDGEQLAIGKLVLRVMLSPGHTLGSVTYLVGDDTAFVHDTLMQPDSGTARADFPGGDAAALYRSITAILALPGETRLFVGHDYCPNGREPEWEATVAAHRLGNTHVRDGISEAEFVQLRQARDRTLALPDRMLFALQVNLRGGRLPEPEADGRSYFKIPCNRF